MSIIAFPSAASARSENRPVRQSLLRLWLQRIRARRSLAVLNPDQLRDAGIEPWRLRHEIRKPFWRG
ncbi:DUF1127 domain-containing protein [Methylobacterium brachiatum]|uniref:DUF1127 domain-containing protein n=1 Tax=Methylobacterium brachiatum TaxID=269660 RepID=UPI0008EE76E5|nr:DUF1127 domain-containing protein [Methylobacterium brachiatum]SFJ00385.1 protein of unknown function [Methylobacterium brachiatum]